MDNIFNFDGDDSSFALVIPHIQYVKYKDNKIEIIYNALSIKPAFEINFQNNQEAKKTYFELCNKIETYYQAIKPSRFDKLENLDISIGNVNLVKNQTENNIQ